MSPASRSRFSLRSGRLYRASSARAELSTCVGNHIDRALEILAAVGKRKVETRRATAVGTLDCGYEMREIAAQGSHPGDLVEVDGGGGDSMDL